MEADIAAGRVDLKVDPSFLMEPKDEEPIGPFDMREDRKYTPGYLNGASIDQISRYEEKSGATDLEAYAFQLHLHHHRIGRQGFATFCRDFEEIEKFREWTFKAAKNDGLIHSKDKIDLDLGWPQTQEVMWMPDQEDIWFRNFEAREKRLLARRKKWECVLRKREEERKAAREAAKAGGPKAIRRRESRERERWAQLRADRAEKELRDHILYCQLAPFLSDDKPKAK